MYRQRSVVAAFEALWRPVSLPGLAGRHVEQYLLISIEDCDVLAVVEI
jgi:hypothetical protein